MRALLCAWCRGPCDRPDAPCGACGKAPTLDGRFALRALLGRGATGTTWRASPLAGGPDVAIKELSVRRLTDLDQLTYFAREAAALKGLNHPGIPAHHGDFTVEDTRDVSLYIVQELIDGAPLDPARGTDEAAVLRLLRELGGVLVYLGARRPPVVHRDIKPPNIMRRPDGRLVLIDFGATRAAFASLSGALSVAGTLGYMAPEQLRGQATPASDVLWRELDAWDDAPEARALFVKLANQVWCSLPGPMGSSASEMMWGQGHNAMGDLAAAAELTATQREHVELVLLVCHAAFSASARFKASLEALDAMTPRHATVEALLAAVDEASTDARAVALAERYLHERQSDHSTR